MKSELVTFSGANGIQLSGALTAPDAGAKAWVLIAHCFTCTKNYKGMVAVSRVLTEHGYGVFRFDFSGLGESKGVFADTNFSTNLADLHAAAAYLESRGAAPKVLLGHSLGGSAVLRVASEIPSVRCVVTVATPFEPRGLLRLFSAVEADLSNDYTIDVMVSGHVMPFKKQFVDDLRNHELAHFIEHLGLPLLIFHSPADRTTPIENAEKIFFTAKHPKSFVSLGEADHLLSQKADAEFAGRIIAAWAERYV